MFLLLNMAYQKGNRNYTTQSNRNFEVKSITKMKILLGRLSRVEMAEESISELESRSVEIIQSEE